MKNKYYNTYELIKDTPEYPKGWLFSWCGIRREYLPHEKAGIWHEKDAICSPYSKDYNPQLRTYKKEKIEASNEWFKPIGEAKDFYPQFPSKARIEDFTYLQLTTRLVDSVDEARCLSDLFQSKKFQDELYEFVKEKYEEKYFNK